MMQSNKEKLTVLLFLLFQSLGMSSLLLAQSYTTDDKILYMSQIWKDAKTRFHSPDHLQTINWDSIYVSSMQKALKTKDDNEFYLVMRAFLAQLNDGHSNMNYNNFLFNTLGTDFIPIDIKRIEDKYYTLGIDKSLSGKIPLGSQIIKLNDMPTQEYLDLYIMQYAFGSTFQDKVDNALQFLYASSKANDSIRLQIKTPQGNIRDVSLKYDARKRNIRREQMESTEYSSVNYFPSTSTYLTKDSKQRDYYYLRLDNFMNRNMTEMIREEADDIQKAAYIVLDLRHNRGGSELEADTLLMCFLEIDTLITYTSQTRKDNAYYAAMGYGYPEYKDYYQDTMMDILPADTLIKKDLPLFSQPLFVLISEKTYSAAEDFLFTLKLHYPDRAILIGTPTGGSTGAPFVRRLPYHNAYYRICTRKAVLPEGLFDNGVQPDSFYEMSIEDHLKGTDRILDIITFQPHENKQNTLP